MKRLALFALIAWPCLAAFGIADEPARTEAFTSGREGYHTFRIPALVVSREGTLLAFCEGRKDDRRDHGDIDLVLKRSTDGGKTWGPLQLVYEEGGTEKITIGNPCPVVDRSTGTVWLLFCRDNDDVLVTGSTDDGATWSKPRDITADVKRPDWTWYATGPGNGIQLQRGPHKGRLVIPCDHRVGDKTSWELGGRSHVVYSDDHGRTWQVGEPTAWGMNECAAAELADGRVMLNMRSYRGKHRRGVATSDDGGETWSDVSDDPALIEPVCQASLIRYSWPDAGDPGRLLFSNPASETKRHRMTVRLSTDEGKTWPVAREIHTGPAAYSNLSALPDASIGLLYEAGQSHAYERIEFAKFTLDWLTEGTGDQPPR